MQFTDWPTRQETLLLKILQRQPELRSAEVAFVAETNKSTAHVLLNRLVRKGFVLKKMLESTVVPRTPVQRPAPVYCLTGAGEITLQAEETVSSLMLDM